MYSRNDDGPPERPPHPLPQWSITGRLTTYYALTSFVLLNIATALLYWGLTTIVNKQSLRYLDDEIRVIANVLAVPGSAEVLRQKLEVGYAAREFMRTYGRVIDARGRVIAETRRMADLLPPSAFPPPPGQDTANVRWEGSEDGRKTFLLRSVSLDHGHTAGWILQIAFDTTYLNTILEEYRFNLLAALVIGTLASAALGAYIVQKGMRPLEELAERTTRISTSNLDERITLAHWPREMRALAKAFDDMLDRLQKSFERLSGYVSNMAHELRTPINILLGEAEVALSQARDADDYRKVLESNVEEYHRLSRTIDSLLFIARSDMKESPLTVEEVEPCREIEQLLEYYLPIIEDKEISVTCSASIPLFADRTLFRRAVSNLLSNAVTYSIHGGRLTVTTTPAESGGVDVAIGDTGCGIAPDDLPRIFDRFYRAEKTRFLNPQGSGLGLSIVKSIMAMHGGSVTIASELNSGTTVTLHFPGPPAGR